MESVNIPQTLFWCVQIGHERYINTNTFATAQLLVDFINNLAQSGTLCGFAQFSSAIEAQDYSNRYLEKLKGEKNEANFH